MHGNLGYLFAAFAATWVLLFVYIFIVQRLLGETRRRLRWLEEDRAARTQSDGSDRPAPTA